jgi:5-hydroxyisourate hydrolase-like protein (transthyretin family)
MRRHLQDLIGLLAILTLAAELASAQGFKYLEVKVVDPDGKPMADVPVNIGMAGTSFPMPTDEKGTVAFNVPGDGSGRVQLSVKHDGYLAQGVSWNEGEAVAETFTIPMKKGVPIGGIVHDEEGKPIEGVKVEGIMVFENSTQLPGKGKLQPYFSGDLATTNKEGRWQNKSAPEPAIELQLRFSHPEYVSDRGDGFRGGNWEELRSLESVVVMKKGIGIEGTVVDAMGKPIVGAKVGLGRGHLDDEMIARTDVEGMYRLNNVQLGANVLTVYADGHSPDQRNLLIKRDMEPVDFQLQPGHKVTFHITDPEGNPISGVGIAVDTWKGSRTLMTLQDRGSTDENGMWTWDSAPTEEVRIDIFHQGYMSVRNQSFAPRDEPYEIIMPRAIKVSGNVVDAETGQPLETFSVIPGSQWNGPNRPPYWHRYMAKPGNDGKFLVEFDEPDEGHLVRIEAEGYRPAISREMNSEEGEVTLEFKLEKGAGPAGIVKLPNGEPAAGVEVALVMANNNRLEIHNGRNSMRSELTTEAEGEFVLPYPEADFKIVCLGDAGWAELDGTIDSDNLEVTLEPWSKVEGVVLQGKMPLSSDEINLEVSRTYEQNGPQVRWFYQVTAEADGTYSFGRVPAGTLTVSRKLKYAELGGSWVTASSHSEQVTVEPGKTATVQLGGNGRAVKGQLALPKDYTETVAWHMGAVLLQENPNAQTASQNVSQALGRAIAQATPPEARPMQAPAQTPRSYAAVPDGEGKFEIFDIEPGTYQMSLQLFIPEGNARSWPPQGTLQEVVIVPAGPTDETVDLGKFEIKIAEPH